MVDTPMNISTIATSVQEQRCTATSFVQEAIERAKKSNEQTNALRCIQEKEALARAQEIDTAVTNGANLGPLAGVPVVIKDNILQHGQPCGCGSQLLKDYIGTYDAFVVEKLVSAGAIIIGRANMDEFAMGSSTETCAWGAVKNPWDLERVPGGSSGGSAAVVASGAVPISLGSDTGGSVRQPAAFTGIVGFKPTYGRISRRGLVAFASSTDQVSPMARTVEDLAITTDVLMGHDALDSTSLDAPPTHDMLSACTQSIDGLKLGLPSEYFSTDIHPGVRKAIEESCARLESLGAKCVEVSLPSTPMAVSCYYIIAPAEASANLARFDGIRYGNRHGGASVDDVFRNTRSAGFGAEVQRRILTGTYVLSAGYFDAYYNKAQAVRQQLSLEMLTALEQVDVLLAPTTPGLPFKIGAHSDPVSMYLEDIFTVPASLAGLPAISVPCGLADNLPVGLQIIAGPLQDAACFSVAAAAEIALPPPPHWVG